MFLTTKFLLEHIDSIYKNSRKNQTNETNEIIIVYLYVYRCIIILYLYPIT